MTRTVVVTGCSSGFGRQVSERLARSGARVYGTMRDVEGKNTEIATKGRHDPCVGIRAVPIGEAMMACVLADHALRHRAQMLG